MRTRLTVIGSADAFNSRGRGNACYLVQDDAGTCCVDFGPTALQGLKARGFEPNDIDAVYLTHLHGDHFGGLHLLFIDAQYRGSRERPLIVAGPLGTRRKVEAWYKQAYGRASGKRRFVTEYVEWPPGAVGVVAGRRVRTFAAQHMRPADGALLLRLETKGATLSFTGDTAWTDALVPLAEKADVLVCECTEEAEPSSQHLSWEVLEPRLRELRARRILLTHLGPRMRALAPRLRVPRVQAADDGLVVTLRKR